MPYWKDAPSVKPEVFLSLSAPFRLLRADRVYGYGHYVFNILRSTLTCLIQTGESCCLRFVGDSRADVIRVHAFLPLWFQSTDPVPDWSCSSYSRVSCPADGRACFVRSLAGRARGEALRQGAGESLGSARGVAPVALSRERLPHRVANAMDRTENPRWCTGGATSSHPAARA